MSEPAQLTRPPWESADTEFLLETSRELCSTLDVGAILSRISLRILGILPASRSGVLLVDEPGRKVMLVAGHTFGPEPPQKVADGERALDIRFYPEIEAARLTREPVVIPDVQTHPLLQPVRDRLEEAGIRSLLVVPLLCQERFLGVISVGEFGRRREFKKREVAICQTIANQAAVALENARLFRRLRDLNATLERKIEERTSRLERAYLQLSLIHGIAKRITETFDADEVLDRAATLLQRTFHYYSAAILVADASRGDLEVRGVACDRSGNARRRRSHRQPQDAGICGWVYRHGEAYLCPDVWQDPHYVGSKLSACRSELCVPIRMDGRTVAVLDVQSRRRNAFSDQDRVALETLAETLSVALRNAALFAELREGRQFTEEIFQNLSGGLVVVDRSGAIRRLNLRGAEILRVDPAEALGRRFLDLFPGADALFEYEPAAIGREAEITLRDGARVPLGYSNSFFASSSGGMDAVIVTFRDLSEIHALRQELRRRERLATIGQMAAAVAHEIRNPLFGMTAAAQVIGGESGPGSPVQPLVARMLAETERMNRLVEDLLAYGRERELRRIDCSLRQVWAEVMALHAPMAEARGTRVRVRFRGEGRALLDPAAMKQVALNLLRNAVEAAPGGTVRVTGGAGGGFAWFRVRDDGAGMDERTRERIFEPFFSGKEGGSGLGLALTKRIVEEHGGSISVVSAPGGGAEFTVRLPMQSETHRRTTDRDHDDKHPDRR